ncbi:hypothetical protein ACR79T_12555 [Sphingobacterium spiritivorum]|uniref:hypothetical protein n=1 Tax=Sphingobacterium spiritivorum TaxID=258 RepID=UPI003DA23437
MNIKNTIKALLQSKFGGVQLSAARIDAIAGRLEGKVTTEEELLQRMEALNEALPFADIAKEDDRVRSLEAAAKAKGEEKQEEKKSEEKKPAGDEIPAWAQALIEGNKTVTEKLAALEGNKVIGDRKSSILGKLKDADEAYSAKVLRDFGRMSFADDAAFEEYLGEVESDYTGHVQTTAESQLGKDAPFKGIGKDGKITEASQAEVDKLFGDIKI